MKKNLVSRFLCLALLTLSAGAAPPVAIINNATVDYSANKLVIVGANFGSCPIVTLGTVELPVVTASATQIIASFPAATPASSFVAGTYFLSVLFRNGVTVPFDVALGAIGPQGPKGDTGATGATGPQGPK